MRQATNEITIPTDGQALYEFTRQLRSFIAQSGVESGLATVFVRHTSCSLLVQENADPDVQVDMLGYFRRLVPEGMDWLTHTLEGPDDMPAHIKSALTQTSMSIPVIGGKPVFGTWQGIYLFEHRHRPQRREVVLHIIGE